ncbi:MAG: ISAzo13 family transposase, partial [Lyngbya sp. HA4199-MV5]|nr:ISAzo13 family transposase [Lyngbya sp. HA4199-MV5]
RCWGILEQHWNGTQLKDVATMRAWAQSMTWKGTHPIVQLNQKFTRKGFRSPKQRSED